MRPEGASAARWPSSALKVYAAGRGALGRGPLKSLVDGGMLPVHGGPPSLPLGTNPKGCVLQLLPILV
jgi:hypothetical protein